MIVGPGLGGLTASSPMGYLGTLLLAIFISTVTLISIVLWLKESHPIEKRVAQKKTIYLEQFIHS